ncbi:hypothetical protein BDR26DRAFT_897972 [Obelidium mucronatum]|nr:hypothetical protein BDR26DRAFT_897972 [Obelidium mucronatum]
MSIHEKYIAVLEERVTLTQELGAVNGELRDALDKLAASEQLVGALQDEIVQLKKELSAWTVNPAAISAITTQQTASTEFGEAPTEIQLTMSATHPNRPSMLSASGKTFDKLTSVHGSTFYADFQPLPIKRTRTQQQQLEATSSKPAAEMPQQLNGAGGAIGTAISNNTPTATEGTAKRPKLETINVSRAQRSSLSSMTPLYKPQKLSAPVDNAVLLESGGASGGTSNQRILVNVDDHVKKEGSGRQRVITCLYCENVITSRNRSRWERHIRTCHKTPKNVKALFDPNLDAPDSSEEEDEALAAGGEELAVGSGEQRDAQGYSLWDLKELINEHVMKTGMGTARKVFCGYCKVLIASNNKLKWMRHLNQCQHCPAAVKQIFQSIGGGPTLNSTSASQAEVVSASNLGNSTPVEPASVVPITSSANIYPKLEYPVEPHEFLADGTPNTERWRAWTDVIRFQIPTFSIIPASGVRVTKFKRRHNVAEHRLIPQAGTKQHHSSVTFGLPERLHFQFLQFMDPTYRRDIVIPEEVPVPAPRSQPQKQPPKPLRIIVKDPNGDDGAQILSATFTDGGAGNDGDLEGGDQPALNFDGLIKASPALAAEEEIGGKTKYISIIKKILPDFRNLSMDARKAVKRGVKRFLESELADTFVDECVFKDEKGTTYLIPDRLLEAFKEWAQVELSRCFPDKVVKS